MSTTAFALRSEYAGTEGDGAFTGGSATVGFLHLDLAQLLEAGNGTIVVEDAQQGLVDQLDAHPALKRTTVPEGATAVIYWQLYPRLALNEEAARRGLEHYASMSHDDLAAALQAQDVIVTAPRATINGTAHGALRDVPAALQPGVDARELAKANEAPATTPTPATSPSSPRRQRTAGGDNTNGGETR